MHKVIKVRLTYWCDLEHVRHRVRQPLFQLIIVLFVIRVIEGLVKQLTLLTLYKHMCLCAVDTILSPFVIILVKSQLFFDLREILMLISVHLMLKFSNRWVSVLNFWFSKGNVSWVTHMFVIFMFSFLMPLVNCLIIFLLLR